MGIELVRPELQSSFDAGEIAPALTESTIKHTYRPEDDIHQFDFGVEFDAPMLVASLAMRPEVVTGSHVPEPSEYRLTRGVKSGLKTLTYPNSRVMRNAKYIQKDARAQLLSARGDIAGLVQTIDHPEHHRMVPARLTIYSELLAELAIDDSLQGLKPQAIRKLCAELGVDVDELALRRLKGRNRDTYVDAAEYVQDPELLKALLKLKRFKRAVILPDEDETVLTDNDDWPKGGWAEKAEAIQLLHMLPESNLDLLGARWRVLIRDDSSPRHVVKPQLLIKSDVEARRNQVAQSPKQAHVWTTPEIYPVFESQPPIYDRTTHAVVHSSPVLGAVLLMQGTVGSGLMRSRLKTALFKKGPYIPHATELPDKAYGLAPLLVQNHTVQHLMTTSRTFTRLARHVDAELEVRH